jgi:hypothetical protein
VRGVRRRGRGALAAADPAQVDEARVTPSLWTGVHLPPLTAETLRSALTAQRRADDLLRRWLTPEQQEQLAAYRAFAVSPPLELWPSPLVLVRGMGMVYDPSGAIAYGWGPVDHLTLPDADVLLCQALALSQPGGREEMLLSACRYSRSTGWRQREVAPDGPAWRAVDLVMDSTW